MAFGAPTPAEMEDFLATYVDARWSRMLEGRYFQGTITLVVQNPSGAGWLVNIRRTNEVASDPMQYLSINPGYYPQVGDVVECFWRDSNVGLVFGPANKARTAGTTLAYASQSTDVGPFSADTLLVAAAAVTVGAGRRVRIKAQVSDSSPTTVGDVFGLTIKRGATRVSFKTGSVVAAGDRQGYTVEGIEVPGAGSFTYQVNGFRVSGTGTVTMHSYADAAIWISVEDIGI